MFDWLLLKLISVLYLQKAMYRPQILIRFAASKTGNEYNLLDESEWIL
ncbi:unnamed protein product, partial [Allacma fusca]